MLCDTQFLARMSAFAIATSAMPPPICRFSLRLFTSDQELVSLKRSLPLGRREAVLLRYDEERADMIKILVIGTAGTPYAGGSVSVHSPHPAVEIPAQTFESSEFAPRRRVDRRAVRGTKMRVRRGRYGDAFFDRPFDDDDLTKMDRPGRARRL